MIEKIMKTVKSGNKKRGRNITIGAVVGMLLSCTVAMGADVSGLDITQDTGGIKFSKNYTENTWENDTYTNTTTISGESADGKGYGVKLSGDLNGVSFINNGTIVGTSKASTSSNYGYGIYNTGTITKLTNNGSVTGIVNTRSNYSYGIYNDIGTITELTNNGSVTGTSAEDSASGIKIVYGGTIGTLTNNGTIIGRASGQYGSAYGIEGKSTTLTNNGTIIGKASGQTSPGYGIVGVSSSEGTLTNIGVIYGKRNAIMLVGTVNNYGILVNSTDVTVSSVGETNNSGLIFKEVSGKYTATENDFKKFGQVSEDGGYKIINANAKNNNKEDIEGTESLTLENGKLLYKDSADNNKVEKIDLNKKYILNGITDTLLVSTGKNILNDSVINAYKTAVVMNGENLYLELNDTTVNGGIDGTSSVISVTGDNNFLTVSGDSIVNGKMSATGEKNTLNLYGKQNMTKSNDNENMNIFHDIEGFGRIQIENNVTFFEDVKVTGVDRININNGGTLSLRLKAAEAPNTKATHALNDHADGANDSTLLIAGKEEGGSETAGTLNFITNGMGTGTVIDMGGIKLENVYLRANSILYDLKVVKEEDSDANIGDIKLDVGASLVVREPLLLIHILNIVLFQMKCCITH